MTRVLHVIVGGELGGAERMLADLASGPHAGVDHAVAVFSPGDDLAGALRSRGLRVFARRSPEGPLPFLSRSFGTSDVAWVVGLLRTERTSLVHLHTVASQVPGTRAARATGLPVLRTEHSTRAFDDASVWPFSRWSLARAAVSVPVSRHVLGVAARRAPWALARMRVVHNGVDVDRFGLTPPPDDAPLRVAFVGRLEPRKGPDLAIQAVARAPGVHLDVVGSGELRPSLEVLARRLGAAHRVRFLGFTDDVRPAVASCHALLCASRREGLGVALLEGMAMQRPVLGFRVGGVPEIVGDGLDEGLVPEGDVPALARALLRAAAEPRRLRALGEMARERVVGRFSVAAMRAGYARAYAEALSGATMSCP